LRGIAGTALGPSTCGGPAHHTHRRAGNWRALGLTLLAALLFSPAPAEANRRDGFWGQNGPWPLIPIHMLLLPEGRVLTYGSNPDGTQTGRFWYDVWDPAQGSIAGGHLTLRNTTSTDLFCSAQLVLPGSRDALLLGGDNWISSARATNNRGNNDSLIFNNAASPTLSKARDMNRARWYATATTLPNGEIYIQGGKDGTDRAEIRNAAGNFRLLGFDSSALTYWYPRNFVAPDGRVFGISNQSMYWVDTSGNGKLTMAGNTSASSPSGVTTTDVMYDVGKILRTGGGSQSSTGTAQGKRTALVIDINGSAPKVTSTAAMPAGLHWHTGTVVADGRVVVTGGSQQPNQLNGVNYRALIWDPATGKWTVGASTNTNSAYARLYHSNALLLPDATILVGGGGAPGPVVNTNAQVYYPPYLFTNSGKFAPRPLIMRAPSKVNWGQTFDLRVDRPLSITRVTLVKTGSVTHGFNLESRFMELPFTRSGTTLKVQAPASANLATPGYYLLFVLDAQGVPSIARVVAL
jgi:hypothetical protein